MDHLSGPPQSVIVGATEFRVGDTIEFKSKWLGKMFAGQISSIHSKDAQVFIGKNKLGQITYELVDLEKARKL